MKLLNGERETQIEWVDVEEYMELSRTGSPSIV
jgi:hypothetical protein